MKVKIFVAILFFHSIIGKLLDMTAHDNTSIRMLPQKLFKPGQCRVCGMNRILKWTDQELGGLGLFGDCCYAAVVRADYCLRGFSRPGKVTR